MSPADASWVEFAGRLPDGAVVGGFERNGTPLYVCRAAHERGVHVGQVVGNRCNFGYGGAEIVASRFEVLVGAFDRWVTPARGVPLPDGAIPGGREANGTVLYVCRGNHQGSQRVGKLVGARCNSSYGGAEISMSTYEVLLR